jgi:hypothetical protein
VLNFGFCGALAVWTLAFAPCAGAQVAAGSAASSTTGTGSGAKTSAGEGFEPLGRWAKAVLAGDRAALSQLYVSSPQAYAQTPDGKIPNPGAEESSYWAKFAVNGLTAIDPKILEQTVPQPNSAEVVLRVEMTFGSNRREFVSTGQLWVLQQNVWRIAIVQRGDAEPMVALRLPEPKVPNIHLYPEPGEAQKDLDAAFALAKEDHKRVLVIFGANWCYDCHVLDATMRSKEAAALVAGNYHVVHVNIGDGDANGNLATRFQIPLEKGIPSLAVLGADGSVITSQKQGEFESAEKIGMEDVAGFLERWKAGAR